jgi:hypothetical protein
MIPAEAYIIPLDVVVKAVKDDGSGRRMVEVEASSEDVDDQGDIVLQSALLNSAASFIKSGHLDLDHYSEIGHRIGILDPSSYIVGRPTEVKDIGGKRTSVVGEIMRARDGKFDSDGNKYDGFWKTLQSDPPVHWSASIYGFPSDIQDCTEKACSNGATRYVVKAIDWRSLAFTRKPVNKSLKGYAKIVTAKSYGDEIRKDMMNPMGLSDVAEPQPGMSFFQPVMPNTMDSLWGAYHRHMKSACPYCREGNSVLAFKDHFMFCSGASPETADLFAHALMYMILKDRKRGG